MKPRSCGQRTLVCAPDRVAHQLKSEPKTQPRSACSQMLTSVSQPAFRCDYEGSDPAGMMHMNRSDISEFRVRKRGELF
jgi:hypothetical protein